MRSIFIALVLLSGCAATNAPITASGSQVQLRQMQTREYDATTQDTLRAVVGTLQDLGFVIDKADSELATITATKLQKYEIRMTVTVRERGEERQSVRANARFKDKPILDGGTYRDFFAALDRSLFLTHNNVD